MTDASRPARGAWVEITFSPAMPPRRCGRAPQGARGLKYQGGRRAVGAAQSRPARGAWVEIASKAKAATCWGCRAPQGARGLKSRSPRPVSAGKGRAPQGARGLKLPSYSLSLLYCCRAPQGARGLKRSRILIAVSLHKKEVSANRQRLPFIFLFY